MSPAPPNSPPLPRRPLRGYVSPAPPGRCGGRVAAAIAVGGALVLLLSVARAARAGVEEAVLHNEEGIRRLRDGDPEGAVLAFEAAQTAQPGSGVIERNLAAALAALGRQRRLARRTDEALDLLDRAVRLHPQRLQFRVLRGRSRFESGSDALQALAREDFEYVLARDPHHLDALVNLGHVAYLERRLEEAVQVWKRALELTPSDSELVALLAKAENELRVEQGYETLRAGSFLLRHAPEIGRERAALVLSLCEEAYGDLSRQLDVYPERVVVTLYTPGQFRAATSMHAWVAGLYDGTIRLTVAPTASVDDLRATVYHELTHQLIRSVAAKVPVWLHEGLAQLAEKRSAESACARLRATTPPPTFSELSLSVLGQSDPRRVGRFYDLALAITSYLREQRHDAGISEVLRRLGDGASERAAIQAVYGSPPDELFARWLARLRE